MLFWRTGGCFWFRGQGGGPLHRKRAGEKRAARIGVGGGEVAPMRPQDTEGDCQAQTRATGPPVSRGFRPIERSEEMREIPWGNARSRVLDAKDISATLLVP
jgi:hypothetical protein